MTGINVRRGALPTLCFLLELAILDVMVASETKPMRMHANRASGIWLRCCCAFEHESQVDRWVDLMLPKRVKDGEYSWWQLQLTDGYSEWVPVVSEPEEVHEDENHNEDESDSGEDTD
jgi:hypothetical protein